MTNAVANMVQISGGSFVMGSNRHYPEEAPERTVEVATFKIDATAVTNDAFSAFVAATNYVTTCESHCDALHSASGSYVFTMTDGAVSLLDPTQWWRFVTGATWNHPEGPQSDLTGRGTHPAVHISYLDALAYAKWVGKTLPTEAQWELAATISASDRSPLNVWQGAFPFRHDTRTSAPFTTPSAQTDAPRSGLHNMLGNVWEWTQDKFLAQPSGKSTCCSVATNAPISVERVLKGGSHLCAASYCRRYRPAARIGAAKESSTSHTGFRCVIG
jgi:formylglycine-generating enzyme required for sulfatase activity